MRKFRQSYIANHIAGYGIDLNIFAPNYGSDVLNKYPNVLHLEGDMNEWRNRQLPVEQ